MSEENQGALPAIYAEEFHKLDVRSQGIVRHILGYAEDRDIPMREFAPSMGTVMEFFRRMLEATRDARLAAEPAPAEVRKGGSAYIGPVPDEAELEAMVEQLPEATRELFLRCTAFQEENRYSAADMLSALADVMDFYAAIKVTRRE
jgi:hypothetical protein